MTKEQIIMAAKKTSERYRYLYSVCEDEKEAAILIAISYAFDEFAEALASQ